MKLSMKLVLNLILATIGIGFHYSASAANTPAAQQTSVKVFHDCADCPEMVVIPSGTFMMGSPKDEVGRYEEESPAHPVHINSIAVGEFDITVGQWKVFVEETKRPVIGGCAWSGLLDAGINPNTLDTAASWRNYGYEQSDTHPVVCITFDDAQD